jgi:hypothetical protein
VAKRRVRTAGIESLATEWSLQIEKHMLTFFWNHAGFHVRFPAAMISSLHRYPWSVTVVHEKLVTRMAYRPMFLDIGVVLKHVNGFTENRERCFLEFLESINGSCLHH